MNTFLKHYVVQFNKQVLYAGEWNSPDCEWDWESEEIQFAKEKDARKLFCTADLSDDEPMVRLIKRTVEYVDGEYYSDEDEVIDERWYGE